MNADADAEANADRPPRRSPDVRVGSTAPDDFVVSVATRSLAARRVHWTLFLPLAAGSFSADQIAKRTLAARLGLGEVLQLLGPLSLTHVRNSGIAFGFLTTLTAAIAVASTLAVAAMLAYFARAGAAHPVLPFALGPIVGGSLSNLADRLRLGYVTDYLLVPHWPSFNLADTFIVGGGVALLVALLMADAATGRRAHYDQPRR